MSDIKVAAAPVSWGVFEKTEGDPLQLGPEQMLDQMAAAGYAGTELGPPGYFGEAVRASTMVLIEEVKDGGYGRADEVFVLPDAYRAPQGA